MTSAGLLLDEPVVPAGPIGSRSGAQVLAEIVPHHIHWYRHGGRTDRRNMVLLCRHHHSQVHDGDLLLTVHGTHLVFTTRPGRELGRHQLSAEP